MPQFVLKKRLQTFLEQIFKVEVMIIGIIFVDLLATFFILEMSSNRAFRDRFWDIVLTNLGTIAVVILSIMGFKKSGKK